MDSPITFREGFLTRGAVHNRREDRLRPPDATSDSMFLKTSPEGPTYDLHPDLLLSDLLTCAGDSWEHLNQLQPLTRGFV